MTAKPATLNLYIYRGDPWSISFSSALDGTPETVVPADALAQLRASVDDAEVLAEFAVTVAGSLVTLTLTEDETAALPESTEAVWDFQPAVDEETWMKGTVVIEGDVSRPVAS